MALGGGKMALVGGIEALVGGKMALGVGAPELGEQRRLRAQSAQRLLQQAAGAASRSAAFGSRHNKNSVQGAEGGREAAGKLDHSPLCASPGTQS